MTPLSQYLGSQVPRIPAQRRPQPARPPMRRRHRPPRQLAAAALLLALLALPAAASASTAPDHIVVSVPSGSFSVGQDIKVTAVAKDANDARMRNYTAPAEWDDTSSTLSPTAPADFVNGVSTTTAHVAQAMSGDYIKVSSGGVTGQSRSFNVVGPVDHFQVKVPSSPTVDAPFTVTVYARDAANALVTGYSGPVKLGDSAGAIAAESSFAGGVSKTPVTVSAPLRGDRITAAIDALEATSGAFNVVGPVDHLEARVPANVSVESPFTLNTYARDAANNVVPSFAPADGTWSAAPSGEGSLGAFSKGVSRTSITLLSEETKIHVSVSAGGLQASSNAFNVVGPFDHFAVTWTRTDGLTGCQPVNHGKLVLKAVDSRGNVIPSYSTGTLGMIDDYSPFTLVDPVLAGFVKGVSTTPDVVVDYQGQTLPDHDYVLVVDQYAPRAIFDVC